MPLPRFGPLPLDADAVLRRQGADPAVVRARSPRAAAAADAAVAAARGLLRPVAACEVRRVAGVRHERVRLEGGGALSGPFVGRHLAAATEVVVLACTIGAALEEAVAAAFGDDPAYALALDTAGTLAVEALSAAACAHLARHAAAAGLQATLPLSPGLEGWPVAAGQRQLFAVLDPQRAGLVLTADGQMTPRKSVSMVLGLGRDVVRAGRPCDYCGVRATCRHQEAYA